MGFDLRCDKENLNTKYSCLPGSGAEEGYSSMRAVLMAEAEEKGVGSLAGHLCFVPWHRSCPLSLSLTSVCWVGGTEDVPIIRKPSRSIVLTLRDIIKERGEEKKKPFIEHICFQAVQKEKLSSVLSVLIEKYFHTSTSWLIFHAVMLLPATFWCGLCAAAGGCSFNPSQAPDNVKERLLVLRVLL